MHGRKPAVRHFATAMDAAKPIGRRGSAVLKETSAGSALGTAAGGQVRPTISVVIPCYNQEPYLAEAIGSVRSQTFMDWECIVVDDGSTDGSAAVVESIARADPRVRLLRQENSGVSAARNLGVAHARGRYIQFLDGDDVLLPEKFSVQLSAFAADPELDIAYCDFEYMEGSRFEHRSPSPAHYRDKAAARNVAKGLVTGNFVNVAAPLVRAGAFEGIGLFDERLVGCEDYDLWLRFAIAGRKFEWSERVLARYRMTERSASKARIRMVRSMIEVLLRVPDYAGKLDSEMLLAWRYTVAEYCGYLASALRDTGAPLRALRAAFVARLAPALGRSAAGRGVLRQVVRAGCGRVPAPGRRR